MLAEVVEAAGRRPRRPADRGRDLRRRRLQHRLPGDGRTGAGSGPRPERRTLRRAAPRRLWPDRFRLVRRPFSELEDALEEAAVPHCDALVFDIGVSSMQLDEAERGFSFLRDGPLDMRMGGEGGPTAADLVNDRRARRAGPHLSPLRRGACRRGGSPQPLMRDDAPSGASTRTGDLADTVEAALGGRRGAPTHPATRTFQALQNRGQRRAGRAGGGARRRRTRAGPGRPAGGGDASTPWRTGSSRLS